MIGDIVTPFFRYIGGKSKVLPSIYPLFPTTSIDTIVDCFGGSGVVIVNCNYNRRIYNEVNPNNLAIFKHLTESSKFDELLFELIDENLDYNEQLFDNAVNWLSMQNDIDINDLETAKQAFKIQLFSWNGNQKQWRNIKTGIEKIEYLEHLQKLVFYKNRFIGIEVTVDEDTSGLELTATELKEYREFQKANNIYTDNIDEDDKTALRSQLCKYYKIINKYKNMENTFLYLDPPYTFDTRRSSDYYRYELGNRQQFALMKIVQNMKAKAMISGYDNVLYNAYLNNTNGWQKISVGEFHVGNTVTVGKSHTLKEEFVWVNYDINAL